MRPSRHRAAPRRARRAVLLVLTSVVTAAASGLVTASAPGAGAATPVLVERHTLEDYPVADGDSMLGLPPGWHGWGYYVDPDSYIYPALAGRVTIGTMAGPQVLRPFKFRGVSIGRTTDTVVRPGVTYTLRVAAGDAAQVRPFGSVLSILAGGRTVATRAVTRPPAPGSFGDLALSWTGTQAFAGKRLGVTLGVIDSGPGPTDVRRADYDDIRVTSQGTAVAPTRVVVAAPVAGQVVQRSGSTADVRLRLTNPAGTTTKARLVVRDTGTTPPRGRTTAWYPVTGHGYAALTIPGVRTGWYDLQVTSTGTAAGAVTIPRVGVGEVFLVAGQSNAANNGKPRQQVHDPRATAPGLAFGAWRGVPDDPQPNSTNINGSPWPAFADSMVAAYDLPVGFVSVGFGGTRISQWQPGGPMYARLRDAADELGPQGFRAVLWHHGEGDARACVPEATYTASMHRLVERLRTDLRRPDLPWITATATAFPNATAPCRDAIRAAQAQVRADDPLVLEGPDTDSYVTDGLSWDGIHFNGAGLTRHGEAWTTAVTDSGLLPAP